METSGVVRWADTIGRHTHAPGVDEPAPKHPSFHTHPACTPYGYAMQERGIQVVRLANTGKAFTTRAGGHVRSDPSEWERRLRLWQSECSSEKHERRPGFRSGGGVTTPSTFHGCPPLCRPFYSPPEPRPSSSLSRGHHLDSAFHEGEMSARGSKEIMNRHNIPLGKILGIPIGLDYSWFVIFALLTWMLAGSYYPAEYGNWPTLRCWSIGAMTATMLLMSALLHGLGHSRPARRQRIRVGR